MTTRNRGGSQSQSSAIRTILGFLLCALLSFGLGFFVLARFWSSPQNESKATAAPTPHASAAPSESSDPAVRAPAAPRPSVPAPTAGPRIDPALEGSPGASPDAQKSGPSEFADKQGIDDSAVPPPDTSSDTGKHRLRRSGAPSDPAPVDGDQPARSPDTPPVSAEPDGSTPPDTGDAAPPTSKPGLYRVQMGVFSTREQAEELAHKASDQGLHAVVQAYSAGGRTLYRVQHRSYRRKATAEGAKQKLIDAGFEASVIGN